jgi:hypothetical protein
MDIARIPVLSYFVFCMDDMFIDDKDIKIVRCGINYKDSLTMCIPQIL